MCFSLVSVVSVISQHGPVAALTNERLLLGYSGHVYCGVWATMPASQLLPEGWPGYSELVSFFIFGEKVNLLFKVRPGAREIQ